MCCAFFLRFSLTARLGQLIHTCICPLWMTASHAHLRETKSIRGGGVRAAGVGRGVLVPVLFLAVFVFVFGYRSSAILIAFLILIGGVRVRVPQHALAIRTPEQSHNREIEHVPPQYATHRTLVCIAGNAARSEVAPKNPLSSSSTQKPQVSSHRALFFVRDKPLK